jgi:hypothetical protein
MTLPYTQAHRGLPEFPWYLNRLSTIFFVFFFLPPGICFFADCCRYMWSNHALACPIEKQTGHCYLVFWKYNVAYMQPPLFVSDVVMAVAIISACMCVCVCEGGGCCGCLRMHPFVRACACVHPHALTHFEQTQTPSEFFVWCVGCTQIVH